MENIVAEEIIEPTITGINRETGSSAASDKSVLNDLRRDSIDIRTG
jgi:hypothetical protein